jgi:glycosyltransferase involved in cell wall biosynthesis
MAIQLPKVSIIIPFKEDRGWLDHAISSIENQNYGGEIEIVMSQSSGSVAYNLNEGIKKATGEFIKYLCDDDLLTEYSISCSINAISRGADFIHGNAINFFPNGRIDSYIPKIPIPSLAQMVQKNVIHGGTLMYRAEVFQKVGLFDETLDCAEEYDFNMKCLAHGLKLAYCDAFLYKYRRHEDQKSLGKDVDQNKRALKIKAIQNRYANT